MEKIQLETNLTLVDENFAEAAVSLNPLFRWAKFVLTDDLPNGNKQRIPREEFANLVRTGLYTPIKMRIGGINKDHSFAVPLGVITNLTVEDNKIIGLAALWEKEREADVNLIKSLKDNQIPVNLSWEIYHSDASLEEGGITALKDTCLGAATIVSDPAYKGRTPILKMASLESQIMELEELKAKFDELQKSFEAASQTNEEFKIKLDEKEASLTSLTEELNSLKEEAKNLKEFKQGIELAEQRKLKLASIKTKFVEAGIEKGEDYFSENEERLLSMEEAALDFLIQEMVSTLATASVNKSNSGDIPPLNVTKITKDPKELGRLLRESYKK